MPAKITTLIQAVADMINAAAIAGCPTADRVPTTRFDLAKDKALIDVVDGQGRSYRRLTRARTVPAWGDAPSVDIAIYAKVPARNAPSAAGDNVSELAETIIALFLVIETLGGYRFVEPTMTPLDRDWTVELGVAGYVINLQFSNP